MVVFAPLPSPPLPSRLFSSCSAWRLRPPSLIPLCPPHAAAFLTSSLRGRAFPIPGCRAPGPFARPQQHGRSSGGARQYGLDGSPPDGRARAPRRFRWVRTARAPKSTTASSETTSPKVRPTATLPVRPGPSPRQPGPAGRPDWTGLAFGPACPGSMGCLCTYVSVESVMCDEW